MFQFNIFRVTESVLGLRGVGTRCVPMNSKSWVLRQDDSRVGTRRQESRTGTIGPAVKTLNIYEDVPRGGRAAAPPCSWARRSRALASQDQTIHRLCKRQCADI